MTPSVVVETADQKMTVQEFYRQQEWNFSRIPVYENEKEHITGYVLRDAVLKALSDDKFDTKLANLTRPVLLFC